MRRGSTSVNRASTHASSSTTRAACADSEAARSVCLAMPGGNTISRISAPIYADSRWRPGRRITLKAALPSSKAVANAALPCPIAEITPIPVTTNLGGIEFLQEQIGQLADVLGPEQLDARNRQAK